MEMAVWLTYETCRDVEKNMSYVEKITSDIEKTTSDLFCTFLKN